MAKRLSFNKDQTHVRIFIHLTEENDGAWPVGEILCSVIQRISHKEVFLLTGGLGCCLAAHRRFLAMHWPSCHLGKNNRKD